MAADACQLLSVGRRTATRQHVASVQPQTYTAAIKVNHFPPLYPPPLHLLFLFPFSPFSPLSLPSAITESDSAPVTMTPDSKSMEKMLEKLLILDFARQGFVAPGAFGTGNTTANSNVTSTPISQLGVGTLSFGIKTNSSGGSK